MKTNVKDVKIIKTNETIGKAFIIWPVNGMVFKKGIELGLLTCACTLDTTIEDHCRELGLPMKHVASYIETPPMPIDKAIAFCKMIEHRYETQEMEYTGSFRIISDEHILGVEIQV